MKRKDNQCGSVTLETCIVLPIFMFMFLFISGLFSVVAAQNQMTHALIQSTKSLSLDSYLIESVDSVFEENAVYWSGVSDMILDLIRRNNDIYFTTVFDWYKSDNIDNSVIIMRFIGYLSGGDVQAADQKLRDMGIVEGINGINFDIQVNGEEMIVTIEYEIQYWFDFFDMGTIPMEQSITTHLWKYKANS